MHWIERLLGIAPDGGSGALEALLMLIPLAGFIAVRACRRALARASDDRTPR